MALQLVEKQIPMEVTQLIPGFVRAMSAPILHPDPEIQIIYIGYLPLRA